MRVCVCLCMREEGRGRERERERERGGDGIGYEESEIKQCTYEYVMSGIIHPTYIIVLIFAILHSISGWN